MTSPEQRTENPSDDTDYTVNTLFQRYVQEAFTKDSKTLSTQKKKAAQTEISRFVRHLGSDRSIRTIIPSEIGEYSNDFVKRTSQTEHEKIKSVKKFLAFLVNNQYTNANLSQHLRLRRSRRTRALQNIATKSVNLTQSGYDDMKVQLSQLQKERIRLTGEIERAAADGDVRENAPLEAARENQAMVMSKMRDIESTLKIAEIIDSKTNDTRVQIGSKVSLIQSESGMKLDYQLVEPREASPLNKKISSQSPVGEAILGRRVGDEVTVNTPAGQQTYKVEKTA
ncbi:MAG: transcription elongation factor GreA [SAR202 cluster bacterium]|nr:transcription elongation factor GreA [SAR202 cluster bacterium]